MSSDLWIGDVLLGAAGALGAAVTVAGGASSFDSARRLQLPTAKRVCVVIVDGLGLLNLRAAGHCAPMMAAAHTSELISAMPSTTATNMAALGTGCGAGQTGMLGYTVRSRRPGHRLANLISFNGAEEPEQWQQQPTIFEALASQQRLSVSVGPWTFDGSPLTRAALRGAEFESAESLPDRIDATIDVLAEPDAALVTLYWGEVDKIGHQHGWNSPAWREQVAALDQQVARLANSLAPGTLLLLTADHGMIDVPHGASHIFDGPARYDLSDRMALRSGVVLLGGEPRCVHVYTEPGATQAVLSNWRHELGERARILSRDEAIAAGWFGPVQPQWRSTIGDVVAAMLGDIAVVDSRVQNEQSLALVGMHGSVTAMERTIPLMRWVA